MRCHCPHELPLETLGLADLKNRILRKSSFQAECIGTESSIVADGLRSCRRDQATVSSSAGVSDRDPICMTTRKTRRTSLVVSMPVNC